MNNFRLNTLFYNPSPLLFKNQILNSLTDQYKKIAAIIAIALALLATCSILYRFGSKKKNLPPKISSSKSSLVHAPLPVLPPKGSNTTPHSILDPKILTPSKQDNMKSVVHVPLPVLPPKGNNTTPQSIFDKNFDKKILGKIFSHLTPIEQDNMKLVSKNWKASVPPHPIHQLALDNLKKIRNEFKDLFDNPRECYMVIWFDSQGEVKAVGPDHDIGRYQNCFYPNQRMSIEKKRPQAKYSVSDKEIQLYRNFNKNGYFAYRDELPTLYDGNIEFRWKDHELEEGSLYLNNQELYFLICRLNLNDYRQTLHGLVKNFGCVGTSFKNNINDPKINDVWNEMISIIEHKVNQVGRANFYSIL